MISNRDTIKYKGVVGEHLSTLANVEPNDDFPVEKAQISNVKLWFENLDEKEIKDISDAVEKTVDYIQKFNPHYIIVTGSSRRLLKGLLAGYDLGESQIVSIDPTENASIYKRQSGDKRASEEESSDWYKKRSQTLREVLKTKTGDDLDGKRVLILEDYTNFGFKARDFLRILSHVKELQDYRFLSISMPTHNQATNNIGQDQLAHFAYASESKIQTLSNLSILMRILDPMRIRLEGKSLRSETTPSFKKILRDIIVAVRKQKSN